MTAVAAPLSTTVPLRVAVTPVTLAAAAVVAPGALPTVTEGDAVNALSVPPAMAFWVALTVLLPMVATTVALLQVMVALSPPASVTPVTLITPLAREAAPTLLVTLLVTLPTVPSEEMVMSISPPPMPPVAAV